MQLSLPQLTLSPPAEISLVRGDVLQRWFDHAGQLVAEGGRHSRGWWMHWPGLATFAFGDTGAVEAVPVRSGVEPAIHDVFRRGVTPVVLLARGYEALHASAFVAGDGIAALCATSGTGKSTLAAALATRGLPHFADDTIVYAVADGQPIGFSLPFDPRLDSLAATAVAPHAKRLAVPSSLPLRAVYHLVREDHGDPRVPRFDKIEGAGRFERLLRHAHPFQMGDEPRTRAFVNALLACSEAVKVWDCRFTPDLAALPQLAAAVATHAGEHA